MRNSEQKQFRRKIFLFCIFCNYLIKCEKRSNVSNYVKKMNVKRSGRKIPRDLFISFHVWWSKTHFSLWHERKENSMCRNISLETFSSFVKQSRQFFKIYILTTYSLFVTKSICSLNVWLFLWLCLKAIRQNNKQTSNLFPGHEHWRENNSDHTQKKDQLVHFISLCADLTPLFLRTVVQK